MILVDPETWLYPLVDRRGLHHGGEYETALMLYLRKEGVRIGVGGGERGRAGDDHGRFWIWCRLRRVLAGWGLGGSRKGDGGDGGRELFEKAAGSCVAYVRAVLAAIGKIEADGSTAKKE